MSRIGIRLLTAATAFGLLLSVAPEEGTLSGAAIIAPAHAQQMGNDAYNHPARNRSFAAQMQMQNRLLNGANSGSSAGGLGALNQWVTNYNSSSNSIGNLNEITQILGSGATGSIDANAHQDSSNSNQSAQASTDVEINTEITEVHSQSDSSNNGQSNGSP